MTELDGEAYAKWWKDGADKIIAAFEKLPSDKPDHPMSFAYNREICGRFFMQMYQGPETDGQKRARRQKQIASRKATEAEIKEALGKAQNLLEVLENMHQPAVEAIGGAQRHADYCHSLRLLQVGLEYPQIPKLPDGAGRGRPADQYPLTVAIEVGKFYRFITGRNPTRIRDGLNDGPIDGPYSDVLTTVFNTLGIHASVDGRGRDAIKAMDRMPQN